MQQFHFFVVIYGVIFLFACDTLVLMSSSFGDVSPDTLVLYDETI